MIFYIKNVIYSLHFWVFYYDICIMKIEINASDLKNLFHCKDWTFQNNKKWWIFGWYPYVEGFSYGFVSSILKNIPQLQDLKVYDPFWWSGTTQLMCSIMGINSFFSEVNPFMDFVAQTKVNWVASIINNNEIKDLESEVIRFKNYVKNPLKSNNIKTIDWYDGYFQKDVLSQINSIKWFIKTIKKKHIRNIFLVCLSSLLVKFSNTKRATDLRYKTEQEIKNMDKNFIDGFLISIGQMILDVKSIKDVKMVETKLISNDAKLLNPEFVWEFDLIITSPPYLNGTNYFRNTKIELWILDMINSYDDVKSLINLWITAWINSVSKETSYKNTFDFVQEIVEKLEENIYDKRIPKLIKWYFSDMHDVFGNMNKYLKKWGLVFFDIWDSIFWWVHVKTDKILEKIALINWFKTNEEISLRKRRSKNGSEISQKLFIFEKI